MSLDRHWLLTIRAESRVFRYCTAPHRLTVPIATAAGVTEYGFEPGLDSPDPVESADNVEGLEVAISVVIERALWELLCDEQNLGAWTAELASWEDGQTWEERFVFVDGRIDTPSYAAYGRPVEFSIIDSPWEDRGLVPATTQVATAPAWPVTVGTVLPDSVAGMFYPYVFGCPGVLYATESLTQYAGWPVILVEIDATHRTNQHGTALPCTILIAGHKMSATTVTIYNKTTGGSATGVTVSAGVDGLGQVCTVATFTSVVLAVAEGDELWASCETTTSGGLQNADGTTVRGLGQVADWLFRQSSLRISWGKLTLLQRLNAFNCDFYVNQPSSPWEILNDMILANGIFPAFWRRDAVGHYLAVRPWENVQKVPQLAINVSQGPDRAGNVSVSSSAELASDLVIRFARDESQGVYRRTLAYAPLPESGTTQNIYSAATYARLGYRRKIELELSCVQDPGTARLLLDLAALARSTVIRTVGYVVPSSLKVEPGMVVSLTDPEIRCSNRLFWVVDRQLTSEGAWVQVTLEELIDFVRTSQGGQ